MPLLDDEKTTAVDGPEHDLEAPWNDVDPDFFVPDGSQRGWFSLKRE